MAQSAIAAALLMIAAIFFYRLVEPRHQVRVLQALGIIGVLVLAAGFFIWFKEGASERQTERDLSAVRIVWLRGDSLNGAQKERDPFADVFDSLNPGVELRTLRFEVCNRDPHRQLQHVFFWPETYHAGRSTPWDVVDPQNREPMKLPLSSDTLIGPSSCGVVAYEGMFRILDSVSVSVREVTFGVE